MPFMVPAAFTLAALLAAAPVPGATPFAGPVPVLSWTDCARETGSNSPVLKSARYRLEAARLGRAHALGGFLPSVDGAASVGGGGEPPYFRRSAPGYWSRLGVTQNLFSGFAGISELERAGAALRHEEASYRATEAEVRHDLRSAFAGVLYAQENARMREALAARRMANLEAVRKRVEKAGEDNSAMLSAESEVTRADFEVSRGRRGLQRARQQLSRQMGRPRVLPFEVAQEWDVPAPPAEPDMEAMAEGVPMVRQSLASLDESRAYLAETSARFWPSVDAGAGVQGTGPGWPPSESRSWSADLSISLNLFSGARDWSNLSIARSRVGEASAEVTVARRTAVEALEEALTPFENAYEAVGVARQSLGAAQARADLAREAYAKGETGFDQWSEVESQLAEAETGYLDARREALTAEAGWLKVTGTGLPK
jgi:outer membrane protein